MNSAVKHTPAFEIRAFTEECAGCLRCMLSCSESTAERFSLADSRILVELSDSRCTITFLEGCTRCGVCADNCLYGALQRVLREEG